MIIDAKTVPVLRVLLTLDEAQVLMAALTQFVDNADDMGEVDAELTTRAEWILDELLAVLVPAMEGRP